MNMIKADKESLEALLELLYKTNDCFAIKKAMGEYMPCDRGECSVEFCPYCSAKNLFKYLTDQWEFGEYDD